MRYTIEAYTKFHAFFNILCELNVITNYHITIFRDHGKPGHPATSVEVLLT